ncbi:HD domain-containing protein [Granulicoccus sp. GXG6511]|uniref:[protein-PII] uridylyltransferase family protein n=1 Tax=Granulicoccus sp. GXG6511 TaxID=3381351 RepID=UPI003D7CF269
MTRPSQHSALAEVTTLRTDAGVRGVTSPDTGIRFRADLAGALRRWLSELWQASGTPAKGTALACTGSLARQEGGPHSDLDLIVLHDRGVRAAELSRVAERLWYPIWDSGITLDHAVRSVQDCRRVAATDLNVAGALLDLSLIAGDADLVRRAARQLGEDWRANARKRLPEVLDHIAERHERFGELAQMLEPDLKEAKGGLRDMSVLRTMTASWLADRPHGAIDEANVFLLDVRDALQRVTGRPRNVLTKHDQAEVAAQLGFSDSDELLARLGNSARRISQATHETLRRASQSHRSRLGRRGPRRPELVPLHPGIYAHDGELVVGPIRGGTAEDHDLLPWRAAATSSRQSLPLSPTSARRLADWPAAGASWPVAARGLFADLLAGPGLLETWNSLDLAGVIDRWLPEWAAIRDRPQHNPLHRHTVDRHSLETVLEANRLVDRVDRPDVLLTAALLHDLGKRPGVADHSAAGARLVGVVSDRMGWPEGDRKLLRLLVAEHLTLMALATGHDPTDPGTTHRLADLVEHRAPTLRLLAALTEADARSAGPRTWTAVRASLMKDLVARTLAAIGDHATPAA